MPKLKTRPSNQKYNGNESYLWIHPKILSEKGLNGDGKFLLAIMYNLDNNEKGCFAGNHYLAAKSGFGISKIIRLIGRFKKLGYIIRSQFDGRKRYLFFKSLDDQKEEPASVKKGIRIIKMTKRPVQNHIHNNIDNRKGKIRPKNDNEDNNSAKAENKTVEYLSNNSINERCREYFVHEAKCNDLVPTWSENDSVHLRLLIKKIEGSYYIRRLKLRKDLSKDQYVFGIFKCICDHLPEWCTPTIQSFVNVYRSIMADITKNSRYRHNTGFEISALEGSRNDSQF